MTTTTTTTPDPTTDIISTTATTTFTTTATTYTDTQTTNIVTTTTATTTATTTDVCADTNRNCGAWAERGFCSDPVSSLYLTIICKTSCRSILPADHACAIKTQACPKNCGVVELGGGSCTARKSDGATICSSCNHNRIRFKGACLLEVHCRAQKVQSGKLKGAGCRCANPRCHNCKRRSESQGGDTCTVCRDGWYLLNGDCVEACPATMASSGISLFNRRCLEPFICKGGTIFDRNITSNALVLRGESFGCRCPAPGNLAGGNCYICEHFASGVGDLCARCSGRKNLYNGHCVDECPVGTIEMGEGNYGRECVK